MRRILPTLRIRSLFKTGVAVAAIAKVYDYVDIFGNTLLLFLDIIPYLFNKVVGGF